MPFRKGVLVRVSAAALGCFAVIGAALALPAQAAPASFDIGPQSLASALSEFARQSHEQLLFTPEVVARKSSHGVHGTMEPQGALSILLKDSGLDYVLTPAGAFLVGAPPAAAAAAGQDQTNATQDNSKEAGKNSSQDFRMAQVDQGQTSSLATVEPESKQPPKNKPASLEEVVVTGSRIPVTANQGAQEVHVYTKEAIEQSGQTTVADFLNILPSVSIATTEFAAPQGVGGATTVQLRGLNVGTTLVLLNGRRVEQGGAAGGYFFDLNTIPSVAVERIEIVADGSSAIYGSDAIAGVVNIILKKDFNGFEASAKYGGAAGIDDWTGSAAWGRHGDQGSISIIGSYQTRGSLTASERSITASNDYTSFGGPNANMPTCNPGNVFSVTPGPSGNLAPLPGAPPGSNATFAAVSSTSVTGKPTLSNFTYGALNECAAGAGNALIPASQRLGLFVHGNYDLSSTVEVFTELMYSHVDQRAGGAGAELFGEDGFQSFTVSATNPFNPFGTTVGIATLLPAVPTYQIVDTAFVRALVGARGTLGGEWHWEVAAWDSSDFSTQTNANSIADTTGIQNALNSGNPATALNPFVAGSLGPQALLQSFFSGQYFKYSGRDVSANAFAQGPLLTLPSGPVQLVIGSEYDRSSYYEDDIFTGYEAPNTRFDFQRNNYAVFGEMRVPILGSRTTSQTGDVLAVTLAGRYDHYNDFGGHSTPQYGVEWRPLDTLLLRATYAEAFEAPALLELHVPQVAFPNIPIMDPLTGQAYTTTETYGGNPHLRPDSGRSYTFGFVYKSAAIPDLQVSVTNWNIDENNYIQQLPATAILENGNLFPSDVIRAPPENGQPGRITNLFVTYLNFGRIQIAGLDYQANYRRETAVGTWTPSLGVTQTYRYTEALLPGSSPVNATSEAQDSGDWAPRWKGTAALGWKLGSYSASVDGRYVGRYQDYDSTREIGKLWLFDANLRYAIGQVVASSSPSLRGAYIEIGGVNIFNRLPQYSNFEQSFLGYDPTQADIRGRFLYAQVGVRW